MLEDIPLTTREFVGIISQEKWPRWFANMNERIDPHSGLPLLTPNFEANIDHRANMRLLSWSRNIKSS